MTSASRDVVQILHLEDNADDAALIARHIKKRLGCEITLVTNRSAFEVALAPGKFDLILSDFHIPAYSGAEALEFTRGKEPELPFLFVSGTIGEVAAVDCLKRGATDYILKDAPQRLVPAIERALRDAVERKKQKETEAALAESQNRFQVLVEKLPVGIYIIQDRRFVYANPAFARMLGYSAKELGQLP